MSGDSSFRDIADAVLPNLSEPEFAHWRREEGAKVVTHRGRYWEETHRGFYQPIHYMACLSDEEATRPTPWCWGWRTTVAEPALANATMPVHMIADIQAFNFAVLHSHRRKQIRQCHKHARLVQATGPQVLRDGGYEAFTSTADRRGKRRGYDREQYLAALEQHTTDPKRLILVGLVEGKVGGYIEAYAVEGTAYLHVAFFAREFRWANIGVGLRIAFFEICQRSPGIRRVVSGQHAVENQGLCDFKASLGLEIVHVPARLKMLPFMSGIMRWRAPYVWYRLTGRMPDVTPPASGASSDE